jgi:hypothetical protein
VKVLVNIAKQRRTGVDGIMMVRIVCAAVTIACGLIAVPATAQSLADVARKEEARRATTKKAVKTFTNADLNAADIAPPPTPVAAAARCDTGVKEGECAPPDAAAPSTAPAAEPVMSAREADVRQQASQIRQLLLKGQKEFETLTAAAGNASRTEAERSAAARMASQRDTMLVGTERQWRELEKQVTDERLPRAWLEPTPVLSRRTPQ